MTTRPAQPSDKEHARRVHHLAYRDVVEQEFGSWVEAEQDGWFEKGFSTTHLRIVELDGIAIGAIAVTEADDRVSLLEIQILPDYQNRGIGSRLVKDEIAYAASRCKPLCLQVLRANRARALYERLGFRLVGESEHHFLLRRET